MKPDVDGMSIMVEQDLDGSILHEDRIVDLDEALYSVDLYGDPCEYRINPIPHADAFWHLCSKLFNPFYHTDAFSATAADAYYKYCDKRRNSLL